MKINSLESLLTVGCLLSLPALGGTFSWTNLTSDEDTGLAPSNTYTHVVDFGPDAGAATINGVTFTDKARTGANYTLTGPGGNFVDNVVGALVDTGLGDLFSDFFYGGDGGGVQTLTLTGLREGHSYRTTFFVAGWGNPAVEVSATDAPGIVRMARDGTTAGPDAETQESTGAGSPAAAINYDFVADASGTITFTLDAISSGDTFHHYGFVNQLVGLPDDADADGIPNIYETANGLDPSVKDDQLDLDVDGLKNLDEYTIGTRANNPDTDGDGFKDGVETRTGIFVSLTDTGTNPLNADTDGDGLNDGVETNSGTYVSITNPGTNPLVADTDGDGFNDSFEANAGFNPTVATSNPETTASILTAIEFRFNAALNVSYRIEGSSNLVDWETVEPTITGAGGAVIRFYSTETQSNRFFRAARNQ